MNYFQSYTPSTDAAIFAAWDSEVCKAENSWLREILSRRGEEVFQRFVAQYREISAMPRSARRALQRRLACTRDLSGIPPEWRRKLASSIAGAALLVALAQGSSEALTITVTPKSLPGINDGDHICSLFEAIENANDTVDGKPHHDCDPGDPLAPNTIVLPAKGSFTLTAPSDTYYGYGTGLPLITSQITIQGNGAKILRSKKSATNFRLIAVSPSGDLTLDRVTLSGGNAPNYNSGGAVFNYGNLTITNSILSANYAYYGGAIYNKSSVPGYGNLTITNTNITGNSARFGAGIASYGTLTITGGTISKNAAKFNTVNYSGGKGGGVLTSGGDNDSITGCVITGNSAAYFGGGIFSQSNLTITGSTISKNSSSGVIISGYLSAGNGGGIFNGGSLGLYNSTITGNKARYGGGVNNSGDFYMQGGTITKNSATKYGGGLFNFGTYFNNGGIIIGNKAPKGFPPDIFPLP